MKLSRLNGWQRLWVVIAVVGLVWAILYGLGNAAKSAPTDYEVLAAFKNPECQYITSLPQGFKLDREPEYGSPCYALFAETKYSDNPPRTADEYETQMSQRYRQALLSWLGASLVMWAIGLALLYGAGATAAWIVRGFRAPPGAP
jgi:hypothetical protein